MRRARWTGAVLAAAAFAALAAGCNVLVGFPDRALAPDDGGVLDSSTDAPSGDASPADAGDGASSATFCAMQSPAPWFCDDFESDAGLGNWTAADGTDAGIVTVEPVDGGHVLHIGNVADVPQVGIDLKKTFNDARAIQRFAFDVNLAEDPNEVIYVAQIDGNGGSNSILMYVYPGKLAFQERVSFQITPPDHVSTIALQNGWNRVEMLLALSNDKPSTLTVKVGGQVGIDNLPLDSSWKISEPTIWLGYSYVNGPPVTAKSFYYDNVILDSR